MYRFIILAREWPRIMTKWEKTEEKLPEYQTQKEKGQLAFKVKFVSMMYLIFAVTEHTLAMAANVYYVKSCRPNQNLLDEYFKSRLTPLFTFSEYALWKGVLGEVAFTLGGFVWNYMNVFVVIVSFGLSSRFKQLNGELLRVKYKSMSEDYWELRRAQYRSLGKLCERVDQFMSPITTIALANNLFFVCIQMMKSMK